MPRNYDAFISYTRQQGAALAESVLDLLKGHQFKVWQDRFHMRGGENFWRQIESAIEDTNYLIMILSADVFEENRQVLRDEWLAARRRGCVVLPVFSKASPINFNSSSVPSWLKKLDCYDLDNGNHRTKLLNDLNTTPQYRSVPHNVEFPTHFIRRGKEMASIVPILTSLSGGGRVAITSVLRGAGGFGKTTLAKAICFEDAVLERYTDGVLWLTVGESERSLATLLTALLQQLGLEIKSTDENTLLGQWREALRTRACLVVLDDVWHESDAKFLIVRETDSAFLITTRILSVSAKIEAQECSVGEMLPDQAISILSLPFGQEAGKFNNLLSNVAEKAGYWPVLLSLIAGQFRVIMRQSGATPELAITIVEEDFSDLGLTAFDQQDSKKREDAIARTIEASLRYLIQNQPSSSEDVHYRELAVFPDDESVELAVLQDFWSLSYSQVRRLARSFDNAGLATFDYSQGLRLHDVMLAYIRSCWNQDELCVLHQRFLLRWHDRCELPHSYAWRWYGWHCLQAGEPEKLASALLDLEWLTLRLTYSDLPSFISRLLAGAENNALPKREFCKAT